MLAARECSIKKKSTREKFLKMQDLQLDAEIRCTMPTGMQRKMRRDLCIASMAGGKPLLQLQP